MTQHPYIPSLGDEIPPYPGLKLTVGTPAWVNPQRRLEVDGFLDTGSDCTVISLELMSELGLEISRANRTIYGIGGGKLPGVSAYVTLSIDAHDLLSIKAYGGPSGLVGRGLVIGRDVLNLLYIELDGPNQIFRIRP